MYHFVNHPDVARIRVSNPGMYGYMPGTGRGWMGMYPNYPFSYVPRQPNPIHAYTARSMMRGCPGQIRCADGRCVDSVTACDDELALTSGASTRRRKYIKRKNPTVVHRLMNSVGLGALAKRW